MISLEKFFKIKLNKHQKKHIESLRWFMTDNEDIKNGKMMGGNRQTGRTELTLMLIIEKSINEKKPVRIFDHTILNSNVGDSHIRYIIKRLENILRKAGIKNYSIQRNNFNNQYYLTTT